MKILIIGYGIVGQAVHNGLKNYPLIQIQIMDPPKDMNPLDNGVQDWSDYNYYDGIIMCLPTPQGPTGECDDMLIEQYHYDIRKHATKVPILIKSTISVELIDLLKDDKFLTTNPEFLTEADSKDEFLHQKFAIFGGYQCRYWYSLFMNAGIYMNSVKFTDIRTAAFAKYTINSFLATKVIFFNELQSMFGKDGFDELTQIVSMDERIGKSHMMVPGSDQKLGFGGMCFPKDTSAFVKSGKGKLTLLEKAREINEELR